MTLDQITSPELSEGAATITREWGKRRGGAMRTCAAAMSALSGEETCRESRTRRSISPQATSSNSAASSKTWNEPKSGSDVVVPLALLQIFGLLYWTSRYCRRRHSRSWRLPVALSPWRYGACRFRSRRGFIALSGIARASSCVFDHQALALRGPLFRDAIEDGALTRIPGWPP